MTQYDYARTRATAERLIARFGQTAALRRVTNTGPEWDPTQTTTDYPCKLAVLDYAKRDVDGTLIRQTDRMVYLSTAGLTISPDVNDTLVIEGSALTVVNVKPLSPAGVVLMYEVQARA